eukprot:s54_g3.t1
MTRKCLACGKAGHRLETCSSKAAFEIRRAKLEKTRHKPGSRNNPGRQSRKKGWSKEKARNSYTKKNVRKTFCKQREQDCRSGWSQFRKKLQKNLGEPMLAYQKLKDAGFLHEPVRCLACGCQSLGPLVENAASDVLSVYRQCGRRECRSKNNVVSYGVFRGLRLNCCDLLRAIENYCGQTYMRAPHVATMELGTSLGRDPCSHVIDTLSALEMEEGKRFSDALTFDHGDLEVDATALRNFFVSKRNPNYQSHIQRFVRKSRKGCPDVMRAHARVLGICQRGGFTALKVLPFRFVAKNGVPPVENTEEVINSGLLKRITKPGKCVLFTDGATSYKSALKKIRMRIQHRKAIHAKKQWSVKTRTKAGHSKIAGTMCIDAQWKSMKKFVHPSFSWDTAAMEDVLLALSLLLLLRVARVGLPPLVATWRSVTVEELDALHEVACLSFRTTPSPSSVRTCKETMRQERVATSMTECLRYCLLADPAYSWEVLRQGCGPLKDAWLRFLRQNPRCPVHVAATLHVLQRRLRIVRDPSDVEKAELCWELLDALSGQEHVHMCQPETPMVEIPADSLRTENQPVDMCQPETPIVQSPAPTPRTESLSKPQPRPWSKYAFSLSRMSCDVEIDVEVPDHVPRGEVQLLPTYFRLLQLHKEDGDSGGLAADVPQWAMAWIDPNFWTLDGLLALHG